MSSEADKSGPVFVFQHSRPDRRGSRATKRNPKSVGDARLWTLQFDSRIAFRNLFCVFGCFSFLLALTLTLLGLENGIRERETK